jgi:hypothetical protein
MTKNSSALWVAVGMPMAALAVYLVGAGDIAFANSRQLTFAPESCAMFECEYASQCYSDHACITQGCQAGYQQCCNDGNWSGCQGGTS